MEGTVTFSDTAIEVPRNVDLLLKQAQQQAAFLLELERKMLANKEYLIKVRLQVKSASLHSAFLAILLLAIQHWIFADTNHDEMMQALRYKDEGWGPEEDAMFGLTPSNASGSGWIE